MGEPAQATPIRAYVGLESAPTEQERVDLAMRELERTGAFDRSWLMIASPTGTGYVNYAAVSILEFLTRGRLRDVAMQYSARPSPLSLDRVERRPAARAMLCAAIARAARPVPAEAAAEGRAVRREPRRVDEPGRVRRPGHAGSRRRRHRLRDLDRHAALQQVEGTGALRRPPRRRPPLVGVFNDIGEWEGARPERARTRSAT